MFKVIAGYKNQTDEKRISVLELTRWSFRNPKRSSSFHHLLFYEVKICFFLKLLQNILYIITLSSIFNGKKLWPLSNYLKKSLSENKTQHKCAIWVHREKLYPKRFHKLCDALKNRKHWKVAFFNFLFPLNADKSLGRLT